MQLLSPGPPPLSLSLRFFFHSLLFPPSSSLPPRALWSCDEGREMCWQLDPTEGPGRVRRRMMRAPRTCDDRFLLEEAQANPRDSTCECDDFHPSLSPSLPPSIHPYLYLSLSPLPSPPLSSPPIYLLTSSTLASPLSFIFENTSYHSNDALFRKMTSHDGEEV